MEKKIFFEQGKILVDRISDYHKTGVLQFKDMQEKETITTVYNEIFPGVRPNLACQECVLLYLNQITVYMHRELPLYLKSLPKVEKKVEVVNPPVKVEEKKPAEVKKEIKNGK